jgi:formate/nitrite transporter FocA (FNT family)
MLRRIWLAAILGVVLGVGVAFIPNTGTSAAPQPLMGFRVTGTEKQNPTTLAPSNPTAPTIELVFLGLLAGLLVATPLFLVTRKRAQ